MLVVLNGVTVLVGTASVVLNLWTTLGFRDTRFREDPLFLFLAWRFDLTLGAELGLLVLDTNGLEVGLESENGLRLGEELERGLSLGDELENGRSLGEELENGLSLGEELENGLGLGELENGLSLGDGLENGLTLGDGMENGLSLGDGLLENGLSLGDGLLDWIIGLGLGELENGLLVGDRLEIGLELRELENGLRLGELENGLRLGDGVVFCTENGDGSDVNWIAGGLGVGEDWAGCGLVGTCGLCTGAEGLVLGFSGRLKTKGS